MGVYRQKSLQRKVGAKWSQLICSSCLLILHFASQMAPLAHHQRLPITRCGKEFFTPRGFRTQGYHGLGVCRVSNGALVLWDPGALRFIAPGPNWLEKSGTALHLSTAK